MEGDELEDVYLFLTRHDTFNITPLTRGGIRGCRAF